MTELSADRNTPELADLGRRVVYPVAADAKVWKGALCAMNGGYLEPGTTDTDLIAVGRADETVDNTGGDDGDVTCTVRRGVFRFENSSGGDEIDLTSVGTTCYIVDDQTVAATDDTGARSPAGTVRNVDDLGVWVEIIRIEAHGHVAGEIALAASKLLGNDASGAVAEALAPVGGYFGTGLFHADGKVGSAPVYDGTPDTLTVDLATGNRFTATLTDDVAQFVISNAPAGWSQLYIQLTQAATAVTYDWGTGFGGTDDDPPVPSAIDDAVDVFRLSSFDGGTSWLVESVVSNLNNDS